MTEQVLWIWSYFRESGQIVGFNTSPAGMVSTWDRTDLMDNLYYVCPSAPLLSISTDGT